jgi:hypothetical protein
MVVSDQIMATNEKKAKVSTFEERLREVLIAG